MSTSTHAHLPASRVIRACHYALTAVAMARHEILEDRAERIRDRGFLLPRRSLRRAMELLTDSEREIARLHMAAEERVVHELMDLSVAAADDDPKFRVYVSARDFQVIKAHFGSEGPL